MGLRGEDAAGVRWWFRGRRVVLGPTLMEMRFVDDPLSPKIDLERNGAALRVKIAFERRSDGRRYSGAQGLWFEGQPGWHIDTVQGIARTLSESVTPTWLERLSRAPAISHLSLIHISQPTRPRRNSYAVFCWKKKKNKNKQKKKTNKQNNKRAMK